MVLVLGLDLFQFQFDFLAENVEGPADIRNGIDRHQDILFLAPHIHCPHHSEKGLQIVLSVDVERKGLADQSLFDLVHIPYYGSKFLWVKRDSEESCMAWFLCWEMV